VQAEPEAGPLMSIPRIPAALPSPVSSSGEGRSVLRAKIMQPGSRRKSWQRLKLLPSARGKTLAEWLRELALKAARERPADPTELVLAEVLRCAT
jgi:hypothetical protein